MQDLFVLMPNELSCRQGIPDHDDGTLLELGARGMATEGPQPCGTFPFSIMISSFSQNSNVSTSFNITSTDEMQCERSTSGHLQEV